MSVVKKKGARPENITNNPTTIDDDADWSPNEDKIVFVSKDAKDNLTNAVSARNLRINADGTGKPIRLTNNTEEERAPAWSRTVSGFSLCAEEVHRLRNLHHECRRYRTNPANRQHGRGFDVVMVTGWSEDHGP